MFPDFKPTVRGDTRQPMPRRPRPRRASPKSGDGSETADNYISVPPISHLIYGITLPISPGGIAVIILALSSMNFAERQGLQHRRRFDDDDSDLVAACHRQRWHAVSNALAQIFGAGSRHIASACAAGL
jgi:hypothetical protein